MYSIIFEWLHNLTLPKNFRHGYVNSGPFFHIKIRVMKGLFIMDGLESSAFLCKYAKPTEFAVSGVIWQCLKGHKTMRQFKYLRVHVLRYKICSLKHH
jgi:hypothetical protein